jgi:hypothetical protein
MLEEGRITQATAHILMRSVDEAMDLVSSGPLCDWNSLQSSVRFPSYSWRFSATSLPQRLITYFTVQRLESGCYICAAFLRAHRIARRQLHDFLGKILEFFEMFFCVLPFLWAKNSRLYYMKICHYMLCI